MRAATKWSIAVGLGLGIACAAFATGRAVAGGIPTSQPLVYSGVLQNADGTPFIDAKRHNIEIRLWNDATSTDASAQLCDTLSQPLTTDSTGHFSQVLGEDCTAKIGTNPNAYVEVLLDGAAIGAKRTKLGAVPYAIEAQHAVNADIAASAASAESASHATTANSAVLASSAGGGLLETIDTKLGFFGMSQAYHNPDSSPTPATSVLLQSGTDTPLCDADGFAIVQFPNPFPHGVITIVVTNGDSFVGGAEMWVTEGTTTRQFRVKTTGVAVGKNVRLNWIAVGW